jgi:hypothetical protein
MALTKIKTGSVSDSITLTTPDINGGTIDATVIGGTTPAVATFTTASDASGNVRSGRKNLIINGDMRIAQRGTSFTSPASGQVTCDRWVSGIHTGTGDGNVTQETDAPTAAQSGTRFTHSMKLQVTTANTSIQTTDRKYFLYRAEGQDLAPAGFGQAGTRYMTLSFWHKHTKTGINSLAINNGARNRSYPMEYTQSTSNTWEKAELTFPVDTTGTWPTDNTVGMWIFFGAAFGSNYAGTVNQWGSSQKYGTANQVNNYDSTSNSMQFTGVQLEVGSVATSFEHRSYGEELALCQRYFWRTTGSDYNGVGAGYVRTSSAVRFYIPNPVEMRANGTMSKSGALRCASGASTIDMTTLNAAWTGIRGNMCEFAQSGLTTGHGAILHHQNNTSNYLQIDAEL